jgi:diketogulonate reductase-like aldo/keto reductase
LSLLGEALNTNPPATLELRELGKTGVRIPAIGIGTWRYSGGAAPIQAGLALGARLIDTAEAYSTEEIVAQAIRGIRKDIFLATKVSPRHFRYAEVIKSADESLRRLRTDYIDLYQLHWPNYTVPLEETMGAMEELVDRGKARFIGVSNFMLRDLIKARKALRRHELVSNQVRYNLVDRTIEGGLLGYCQEMQITVIAHSPLAANFATIQAMDPEGILPSLAEIHSRTPAQIAVNWCFSKQGIVTIPRSHSAEHVKENSSASDFKLSAHELSLLESKIKFRKRGSFEIEIRRVARHALQVAGRDL